MMAFTTLEFAGLLFTAVALAVWGWIILAKWNGEL